MWLLIKKMEKHENSEGAGWWLTVLLQADLSSFCPHPDSLKSASVPSHDLTKALEMHINRKPKKTTERIIHPTITDKPKDIRPQIN